MKNLLIFLLGSFLWACNSSNTAEVAEPAETTKSAADHHPATEDGLELNNGEKWEANAETTTGVNNMINIVENGLANQTPPADLVPELDKEMEFIFKKCTMKGAAHDQLHNFLMPLKGIIAHAGEANAGADELKAIHHQLLKYGEYFQ